MLGTSVTDRVDAVARALVLDTPDGLDGVPGAAVLHASLADPAAAREWMADYLAAAPDCEAATLARLAGP